jgi:uncharacterized protein YciI
MIQYAIIANDATDAQALERRTAARTEHLENVKKLKASNNFIKAAAMLNQNGEMCGSIMLMQFENRADFDQYLASEAYVTQNVWGEIKVQEVKVAPI